MKSFKLSKLFTPWMLGSSAPALPGWYRVRSEPLERFWWSCMGYFDGKRWFCYQSRGPCLLVREPLLVVQWQGLRRAAWEAAELIRQNLPVNADAAFAWSQYANFMAGEASPIKTRCLTLELPL